MDDESERRGSPLSVIKWDFSYVTNSWFGRVKVMQFIASLLCGCILPNVIGAYFTRYAFFTFVIWTTFMYVTIDLALRLTSLCNFIPKPLKSSSILIYPVLIAALLFLLCSCLIASVADLSGRHAASAIAAAFGFICMALFITEAVLMAMDMRAVHREESDDMLPRSSGSTRLVISEPTSRNSGHLLPDPPPYTDSPSLSRHSDPKLGDFV